MIPLALPIPLPSAQWLAEALFASTLLMAAVMAVRAPAQRLFGARVAYVLWLLPALRMLLPRLPGPEVAHIHVRLDLSALTHHAAGPPPVVAMGIMPPLPAPAPSWPMPLVETLVALWLAGAALHFAWHVLAHRRFLARALAEAEPVTRDCGITVLAAPQVAGPLATGLFRRLVLLPGDFAARYGPRERRLVLAHEVAHHVRGDLFANMAALLVLSLHWFNPIAHRAYRAFRLDQELACDATVLAHEPADARSIYGAAVVKSAARRFPAAVCAMHPAGLLKRRLKMMTQTAPGVARTIAGIVTGAAIVSAGLFLTASGGVAADRVRAIAPIPPQAPVAPLPPIAPPAPVAPRAPVEPVAAIAPPAPPAPLAPLPHRAGRTRIVIDGREVAPDSPEGRRAMAEADAAAARADEAGDRAAEAGRHAAEAGRHAAEAGRRAEESALEAGRIGNDAARRASLALSQVDVAAITRAAFASARAGLAAACGREARPVRYTDDRAAVAAMARACADGPAVRAEIHRAIADARREIARSRDLSRDERTRALSALDDEASRSGWDRAE